MSIARLLALGAADLLERIDPYSHLQTLVEDAFDSVRCYSDGATLHREVGPCLRCAGSGCINPGEHCEACGGAGSDWASYTFADWIGDLLGGDGP